MCVQLSYKPKSNRKAKAPRCTEVCRSFPYCPCNESCNPPRDATTGLPITGSTADWITQLDDPEQE